jgi:hypothetical protein
MSKHLAMAIMAALAAAAANTASAATIERTRVVMAAASCQSALPVFDGVVRKRPLAVQNEGSTATFITCGLEGTAFAEPHSEVIGVALTNNSDADATVSCTLVDGGNNIANPIYLPISGLVPANSPTTVFEWSASDNEDGAFIYPAISCRLPPGTGIKAVLQIYQEEIGS